MELKNAQELSLNLAEAEEDALNLDWHSD